MQFWRSELRPIVAAVVVVVAVAAWPVGRRGGLIEPVLAWWALTWGALGVPVLLMSCRGNPSGLSRDRRDHVFDWLLAACLGCLSLSTSLLMADAAGDAPPAVHDEYSYLFQAQTFLAGRLWYPSQPDIPQLFDQIHVLNEGKFASRYFPGTGLWLAPFVAIGRPYWALWAAGMVSTMLVFATGRALGGRFVGCSAGVLMALSPALAVISNLLLAHSPTLLGLCLFLFGWVSLQRTRSPVWALAAGLGLTFAMLCRPLTAAAIGLPFGIAALANCRSRSRPGAGNSAEAAGWSAAGRRRFGLELLGLAAPVVVGLGLLGCYNHALTGSVWKTGYQLYNETYSPRHMFGFSNGDRGDQMRGPKWNAAYDLWATNLTWPLALENCQTRLSTSLRETVGLLPFAAAVMVALLTARRSDQFWVLALAALVSLHAAHLPFWFVGLNGYHYVFESLPLYALLIARGGQLACGDGVMRFRPLLAAWWLSLALVPLGVQWFVGEGPCATTTSRMLHAGGPYLAMRRRHAAFRQLVANKVTGRPALVLVEQPPNNFHIDFVVNSPALDGLVLYGRYDPARLEISDIAAAFPERDLYVFRESQWTLEHVSEARGKK